VVPDCRTICNCLIDDCLHIFLQCNQEQRAITSICLRMMLLCFIAEISLVNNASNLSVLYQRLESDSLACRFSCNQRTTTSSHFHFFEDDASSFLLRLFSVYFLPAICLFILEDWNHVRFLCSFAYYLHHKSVKLQEMNLLHMKLRVRYRRDMEIETELQIYLFWFRSSCFQTTQSPQKRF
jgi:hypothetical protein